MAADGDVVAAARHREYDISVLETSQQASTAALAEHEVTLNPVDGPAGHRDRHCSGRASRGIHVHAELGIVRRPRTPERAVPGRHGALRPLEVAGVRSDGPGGIAGADRGDTEHLLSQL